MRQQVSERALRDPKDYHHGVGDRGGKQWFQNNFEPSIRCPLDERIGCAGDGGKWICDPHQLIPKNSCKIVSIGGANNWEFEVAMREFGCSTHTFDHSIGDARRPVLNKPDDIDFHSVRPSVRPPSGYLWRKAPHTARPHERCAPALAAGGRGREGGLRLGHRRPA